MALVLFAIAGVTDGLDGYVAKRFGFVSRLGTVLDPMADKLLIASTYIMLAVLGDIPFWLLILVMFRDLLIVAGYIILVVLMEKPFRKPTFSSKINTFLQIALMVCVLVEKSGILEMPLVIEALIYGVLISTVFSGLQYAWQWIIREEMKDAS